MLSIIHRYVMWELVRSLVVSFAALLGVMLLGALYKPLHVGMAVRNLVALVPLFLPYLYSWVLPAAMLSACIMAYGRLSADNELKAMCTSGIPLRYVCYPALVLAVLATALAIPLNDWVIPTASIVKERELHRLFLNEPFRVSILDAEMTTTISGYKLYVESVEGNVLHNVVVIEPNESHGPASRGRKPGADAGAAPAKEPKKGGATGHASPEVTVYRAERATYSVRPDQRAIRIVLHKAQYVVVLPGRSARQWIEISAEEQIKDIPLGDEDVNLERRSRKTSAQLMAKVAELRRELAEGRGSRKHLEKDLARCRTELRHREALAFSVLSLCFVGVPVGIWMRRQSRLASFAIGVLIFLAQYAMIVGGEGLALEQRLPPWAALWTPNVLMTLVGVVLLVRTFRH